MDIFNFLTPLHWKGIATAVLCGLIVGTERQLSGKPAGIRTSILICLGTYIFVCAGGVILGSEEAQARVVGQIVTGVGFLGAGVILAREGIVLGVTSAAVIWILAGIGVMIGLGRYTAAITLSILTVAILVGMNLLENFVAAFQRGVHAKISHMKKRHYED